MLLCRSLRAAGAASSGLLTRMLPVEQVIDVPKISEDIIRPRLVDRHCVSRRLRNSWWKCRPSCPLLRSCSRLPSISSTFQCRVVCGSSRSGGGGGLQGSFSKDRTQQRLLSRSLTFQFLVLFTIFILILGRQPHPQYRAMRLFNGISALFPHLKKVLRMP